MKQKTLFQHMWKAKRDTRGYHDANITEKQWLRMFNPQLPTLNVNVNNKSSHANAASLMYACMERRLDFIVFRSHFASSIWMARQMVIHGKVKVNGKKLPFPSHTVKDGDVVSVDPESVVTLKKTTEGAKELDFVPQPYQQPWMFLPEYLEVNYNTCSTVFLRDPVTKPSATEVPSPYPPEFHALAFEYYLRRGRNRK
ncbi:alpha-L RNA-binding motif-containing protein [Martensiomyces pterosporus]|nr:alpha-L RNA-binding motif-containing protein [Martensiomyces pterosporus]